MKRNEAKKLIGQRVWAYTAVRGDYEGILTEVKTPPGKPWRGVVEIDTATGADAEWVSRNPEYHKTKKVGEKIEVGGCNIRLLPEAQQETKEFYKGENDGE